MINFNHNNCVNSTSFVKLNILMTRIVYDGRFLWDELTLFKFGPGDFFLMLLKVNFRIYEYLRTTKWLF